jgi:hypothetical protein
LEFWAKESTRSAMTGTLFAGFASVFWPARGSQPGGVAGLDCAEREKKMLELVWIV